jgi:hypothetical protein
LGFLDQRKQAKTQCLQCPNYSSVDDLNSIRHDASRHCGNKKKEYVEAKIDELETNSKINNIRNLYRAISEFKKGYQPRINIVKVEKVDSITDCHSTVARWKKHFSQLLNVLII